MWRTGFGLAVVATLGVSGTALAQTGRITGTVTSSEGNRPVEAAQVVVVGTQLGAATRADGRYTLTMQPGTYRLRVVRIGFAPDTATVVVTADGTVNRSFVLSPTAAQLTSVVVIGYGTQEEKERTGVVAKVTQEDFNQGRIVSAEELVRAKVPGVQVVDNNEPGGGIQIRIRGGTSIGASNDPLYVIDGVPLTIGGGASSGRNPLNFLNPNDIESVNVLKDAAATAIYGSRGANGVVIITTRGGGSGPQFSYTGNYSATRAVGGPDMANATEYRQAVQQAAPGNVSFLGTGNTDWLKAIERNASGLEHNVGFSGKRESMNYRLGLGYLDNEGVLQGTKTNRVSTSLNYSDLLLKDRLNLRAHLKGARTRDDYTPGGVLGNAIAFAPTQPIRNADGTFFEWTEQNLAPVNPVAELALRREQGTTLRSVGNVEGDYSVPFVEGLTTTVRAGWDVNRIERGNFTPTTAWSQQRLVRANAETATPGNINRNNWNEVAVVLDAYGTYKRRVNALASDVDLTAGYSTERYRGEGSQFYANGLSTNLLGLYGVPNFREGVPRYDYNENKLVSGFARANVNFRDRYLFSASVRRDGSSRFSPDNQWSIFPSAAVAWRAIEEPFLKDRFKSLSDLKVRLSYGVNGNQAVGNYIYYTNYVTGNPQAQVQLGNVFVPTIRPSAQNQNLKWEQTASTNLGLDLGFLEDRFTVNVDLYTKTTDDLIFNVPTAAGTALGNTLPSNIGSVRNRGVEFVLDGKLFDGGRRGFSWDANLNASFNQNEFLTLNRQGITEVQTGGVAGGTGTNVQIIRPGLPINSFLLYQHKMENGKPVYRDVNGDGSIQFNDLFVDRNGDGVLNDADRYIAGNPAPKWILGHTSNFRWRAFDGSLTARAYLGNKTYNNVASNFGHFAGLRQNRGPTALHRSALENRFDQALYFSDVYVEDASFLRLDNVTIGYTFDRLAGLRSTRLFGTVQNVGTLTGYSGVDPTASINGIDNQVFPRSRTVLLGLSLGL